MIKFIQLQLIVNNNFTKDSVSIQLKLIRIKQVLKDLKIALLNVNTININKNIQNEFTIFYF
jgi:hypothetical protein